MVRGFVLGVRVKKLTQVCGVTPNPDPYPSPLTLGVAVI